MKIEKNRHLIILRNLLVEESITSDKLALLSFSSVRTVKSDLAFLKEELEKEGAARIVATQSKGYRLECVDKDKFVLFKDEIYRLCSVFSMDSIENLNRRLFILKQLFTNDYVLIDELAEQLHLSRNALADDLKKAGTFLKSYHIKVDSVVGRGLCLKGSEIDLRMAMIETFCEQYHEFTPLYPVEAFNELFFCDRKEYADLRHGFLKLLRESKLSVSDISAKRLATYLCLVKNGNRPEGKVNTMKAPYVYELGKKILDELLPQKNSQFETDAFSMMLLVFSDFDLRTQYNQGVIDDKTLKQNHQALDVIIQNSQRKMYNPFLEREYFDSLRPEFESAMLSIFTRRHFKCLQNKHMIFYNENSENFVEPLNLQFTRIFIQSIGEHLNEDLNSEIAAPIAHLFHYLAEEATYPYRKRRLAVISSDSKFVGEAMKKSVLLHFNNLIEKADVFNQYEMRRVNFADYDAAFNSLSLADIYNNYPIPFAEYHTPLSSAIKKNLFDKVFVHGFDTEALQWFKQVSHFHISTTMESYESFVNAMIYRYGMDDEICQKMTTQIEKDQKILEHYYYNSGISVIFFPSTLSEHEFLDFYIPKKFAIAKNGSRIRGIIAVSLNTDKKAYQLKMIDQMLYLLACNHEFVEDMSKGQDQVIDEVYKYACYQILGELH